MATREEIREGLARRMFDSQMSDDQCFGVAIREKVWEEEREKWLARAYNDLYWLHERGVVIKVEKPFRIGGHVDADGVTAFVSLIERKE